MTLDRWTGRPPSYAERCAGLCGCGVSMAVKHLIVPPWTSALCSLAIMVPRAALWDSEGTACQATVVCAVWRRTGAL